MPLNGLVEWDRYGVREGDDGFIYGWIKRDDGYYDFVSIRFWIDWHNEMKFTFSYLTSSAKYSKEIGTRLGSDLSSYLDCQPASDFPEADVVKWQKAPIDEAAKS